MHTAWCLAYAEMLKVDAEEIENKIAERGMKVRER